MACPDDNALLAYAERTLPEAERATLGSHIDTCEACLAAVCAIVQTQPAEPGAEAPPTVGRYTLVELLGRGGMGAVYAAHDPQLDRKVALKIVRSPRFAEQRVRERLTREARAMARIAHPNVVTVFDAGDLDDGVFIAMELVDGDTLTSWLGAGPRSWRDIVAMFVVVGRGLVAAHAAGIVHRDFKPANVMVDRAGRAAVTDFGIAIAAEAEAIDGAAPVETTVLAGTPRYMSPEQFQTGAIDARSDQYSFGVALFEALYGSHPFGGGTVEEVRDAVLRGVLRAAPADRDVPARVHRVVARALQTRPADRFPDMASLLAALAPPARSWRWPVAGAAALGLAAIAVGLVARRAPSATPPAAQPPATGREIVVVPPFTNTTGDPRLDDTLDVTAAAVIERSSAYRAIAGVDLLDAEGALGVTDGEAAAVKIAEAKHAPVIVARGEVARVGDRFAVRLAAHGGARDVAGFSRSGDAATADEALGIAAQLARELRASLGDPAAPDAVLSPSLAAVHAWAGAQRASHGGDIETAAKGFKAALAADPGFTAAHQALATTLYNAVQRPAAIAELQAAMDGIERLSEREQLRLTSDYYAALGKYEQAISASQKLLALDPDDGMTAINIVSTAVDADDWPLALQLAKRAAERFPNVEVARANLVLTRLGNGELDAAAQAGATMLAEVPTPTAYGRLYVGLVEALRGHADRAAAAYAAIAPTEPQLADHARADLALYEGRLGDAAALLHRYVDPALAKHAPGDATAELIMLAQLELRRGDRVAAAAAARAAMGEGSARVEYMAASLAAEAGDRAGAADKVAAWSKDPSADWRVVGKLLEGDLARLGGQARHALDLYTEAGVLGGTWLAHERTARAAVAAGDAARARQELDWCIAHRGQAAVYAAPSLALLAAVLAAREALH